MNTPSPPSAHLSYQLFFSYVRFRRTLDEEDIAELLTRQKREGFADRHGERWCLGSLLGRVCLEQYFSMRSLAANLEQMERLDRDWATPKALAWLVAATYQPRNHPKDPKSSHRQVVESLLEAKLQDLDREQWGEVGREAMDLLSWKCDQSCTFDSADKGTDVQEKCWRVFSLHWMRAGQYGPLSTHPQWPMWAAEKAVQGLMGVIVQGGDATDAQAILGLSAQPAPADREAWVQAWAHAAERCLDLHHELKNNPTPSSMWRNLIPAAAGAFGLLAHTHGDPDALPEGLDRVLLESTQWLEEAEPGTVPFTERKEVWAVQEALTDKLRGVRMHAQLGPATPTPARGKPARL